MREIPSGPGIAGSLLTRKEPLVLPLGPVRTWEIAGRHFGQTMHLLSKEAVRLPTMV